MKNQQIYLSYGTWLVIFYIMKASHFYQAPKWCFITLWVLFGFNVIVELLGRL